MLEQHQCQQPLCFGVIRHQFHEQSGQAYRLGTEVVSHEPLARARVSLREQQVEDGKHPARALFEQLPRWHAVGDAGGPDLALRPDEALRHRLLRDEEGASDLGGGETADGAQRERRSRLHGEGGVAAGEHQPQAVVADAALIVGLLSSRVRHPGRLFQLARLAGATAQAVQRAVAGHRGDPGARVPRRARLAPGAKSLRERFLRTFLSQVPVAEHADQRRHDARPLVPVGLRDDRFQISGHCWSAGYARRSADQERSTPRSRARSPRPVLPHARPRPAVRHASAGARPRT